MLNRIALLILIAALGGTVHGQDFGATVQVDPRAGTATYDFHFQGPPSGKAWLFVGLNFNNPPLPLPFGPLYIDPGFFIPVTPFVPLDNQGQARVQIPMPLPAVDGLSLTFQPLFIDPQQIVVLPQTAVVLVQGLGRALPLRKPESYAIGYDMDDRTVDFEMWGSPGQQVMIQIFDDQNRLVDTINATVGPNCTSGIVSKQIAGAVGPGYTWKLWEKAGSTLTPVKTGRF